MISETTLVSQQEGRRPGSALVPIWVEPKTFVRLYDALFGPEFDPNVFAYLDDLIIISERNRLLEKILQKLMDAKLRMNEDKCEFSCSSVTYLGFLLDKEGLRQNPERIEPVLDIPSPKNNKYFRRVLGMFGWFH